MMWVRSVSFHPSRRMIIRMMASCWAISIWGRRWWRKNGPELDERELSYAQTKRLEELITAGPGTTVNLPAGWRARKRKGRMILIPAEGKARPRTESDRT